MLERLMYNFLFKYLTENKTLYDKQFGFSNSHSTKHAIIELVDKPLHQFQKNRYMLGIFAELSTTFDTVNHQILVSKHFECNWKYLILV